MSFLLLWGKKTVIALLFFWQLMPEPRKLIRNKEAIIAKTQLNLTGPAPTGVMEAAHYTQEKMKK